MIDLRIEKGQFYVKPNSAISKATIYDYYDGPRIGEFSFAGSRYLFNVYRDLTLSRTSFIPSMEAENIIECIYYLIPDGYIFDWGAEVSPLDSHMFEPVAISRSIGLEIVDFWFLAKNEDS